MSRELPLRFSYRRIDGLPRMAWCLALDPATGVIRVEHGPWVEATENAFYEGAWAGPIEEAGFDRAFFAGSGAVLRDGCLVVATPSDTTEALFSVRARNGRLFFSNSIPFLLKASGEELDLAYRDYELDFMRIADGLDRYPRELPTASGIPFRQHFFCNLRIRPSGEIEEEPKSVPQDPIRSFEEYRTFLRSQIRRVCENAASPARTKTFRPIAFASNGYDSPACAAMAREMGCDEAVVFETKKTDLRSDSGAEIVRRLGYSNVRELHELDYRAHDVADLFVATGELGTSIYFAAAAEPLAGKILFSGVRGDKTWSTEERLITATLKNFFYSDTARKEFRLVTGYLNLPLPFIGAMRHRDIWKVSVSEEMRPWSLHNNYDRPIPRRIVEEKGVPRELFGFAKGGGCGTSLRFGTLRTLKGVMPPASFDRFARYYRRARRKRGHSVDGAKRVLMYWLYAANTFLGLRGMNPFRKFFDARLPKSATCSPFAPSFLFPWGVESVQQSYYAGVERFDSPARAGSAVRAEPSIPAGAGGSASLPG